jgi:hypothetical protein
MDHTSPDDDAYATYGATNVLHRLLGALPTLAVTFRRNKTFVETRTYRGESVFSASIERHMKAFAALRDAMGGSSTQEGIEECLILLNVCQTCKYPGLDFLDFRRSGEKDVVAFAQSRRRSRRTGPAAANASLADVEAS